MYKLLLCLRYLRTRYLAFVCVVSVMLGVATLIVVNSVMAGFSDKLKAHLNGLSSDVTIGTDAAAGFPLPTPELERRLAESPAGPFVEATSPTVETFAVLQFNVYTRNGPVSIVKHVKVIGVDPARHAKVGTFGQHLIENRENPGDCFALTADAKRRFDDRRRWNQQEEALQEEKRAKAAAALPPPEPGKNIFGQPTPVIVPREGELPAPNIHPELPEPLLPEVPPDPPGIVLGYDIGHARLPNPDTGVMEDVQYLWPGDDVFVATVGASGTRPVSATFAVTGFFRSNYGEYDANIVYVPLDYLQRLRGMDGKANRLHIRLVPGVRENPQLVHTAVVPAAQDLMPKPESYAESWWQQQGMMLNAIEIERNLLNILLFLIIGVAGFGVLAIFSMIVSEKYRDIGVMKALGASGGGVMGIFLGYGLLLGLVGGVLGTGLGVWITLNINDIEQALAAITGRQIFDRKVYSFDSIPTHLDALSVLLVNLGAVGIAVASSVLPAVRAARLQPVRALRFE